MIKVQFLHRVSLTPLQTSTSLDKFEALRVSTSPHLPCHLSSLRHYKGVVLAIPCIKSTSRQSKIVLRNINNILSA